MATIERFLFFYLIKDEPDRVRSVAPQHAAYWADLKLPGYIGGPFADRSGGSISFEVESRSEADRLVNKDPFMVADLLSESWLKEWHRG